MPNTILFLFRVSLQRSKKHHLYSERQDIDKKKIIEKKHQKLKIEIAFCTLPYAV